ncbi:ABC-2 family transporter protein [Deinococcus deserti]|uniref:Putative ABC transporter, permease component n=1 Tax=Deinococcus deserti (strain DSM 17065 / CIP 109153 / LMG 22923 / VCD115) TaxID=546414 RepID=C1D1E2_DEIDV|nr:ABC-2 family transporter protein [Deinococcus deserti]ACO45666.1 putative ABC transporter, permease component [Deinococcus deserti VCD115]
MIGATTGRDRRPNFRLYLAVARLSFRRGFAYPQAALWGLITNAFFGVLRAAVLMALFGAQPQVAGFTVQDALTYTAMTQLLIAAFSLFGWSELMRTIHRGEVGTELLRPHHFLLFWTAQDAGRAAGQFVLRGLPILLIFALLWPLSWPQGTEGWTVTALSLLLAWACGFAFRFLVNCAAFWTPDAAGVGRFAWAVLGLSCGFLMPLAFFPDWLRGVLAWTPFPCMLNTSVELWLGVRSGPDAWTALGTQLAWAGALFVAGEFTLRRGLRRLEVAGG